VPSEAASQRLGKYLRQQGARNAQRSARHRGNRAAALFASALTLGLAAAGCGGSSASTTATPPSSGSAGSGSRAAIGSRCAAQAKGDLGAMGLCLASHGVVLPSNGKLVTCAEAANTRAEVTACLAKAAE
jgi:hypothetical protein